MKCVIGSCKNTSNNSSKNKDGITFHRFPKDEGRRRQWWIAVNRQVEWASTSDSAVCSEHFDDHDFYFTDNGLRKVAEDAVPRNNISPSQAKGPRLLVSLPVDIKQTDSEEVVKLKHKVRRLEVLAAKRKKRLNLMSQSKRRLKNELLKMKAIIQHLIRIKEDNIERLI